MTAGPKSLSARDNNNMKTVNQADGTVSTDGATYGQVTAAIATAEARSNHSGTQVAATISDFDTQVRSSRLDQMAAPTGAVSMNGQRSTNLAAATVDTDSAQWGQVKDLISGARKTDVKAVSTSNITLSAPQTVDGISVIAGDRVLVTGQTTASTNGIYVVASGAWTRATDADTASEFATQWLVTVAQGTANADTLWQFSTDAAVTLGTTSLAFVKLGPISSAVDTGVTATSPTTSAGGSWAWAHGLGTKNVLWQMYRTASPFDDVTCYVERTDANTLTFKPDIAMAAGEYTVCARKAV